MVCLDHRTLLSLYSAPVLRASSSSTLIRTWATSSTGEGTIILSSYCLITLHAPHGLAKRACQAYTHLMVTMSRQASDTAVRGEQGRLHGWCKARYRALDPLHRAGAEARLPPQLVSVAPLKLANSLAVRETSQKCTPPRGAVSMSSWASDVGQIRAASISQHELPRMHLCQKVGCSERAPPHTT